MSTLADAIRNALTGVPLPEDRPPLPVARFRHCRDCDVKWFGEPRCWACGSDAGVAWTTN